MAEPIKKREGPNQIEIMLRVPTNFNSNMTR